jgi:hypothetical protein
MTPPSRAFPFPGLVSCRIVQNPETLYRALLVWGTISPWYRLVHVEA